MRPVTIWVDDVPTKAWAGVRVRDMLSRLDPEKRADVEAGRADFVDRYGNELGLDGDLNDGQHLYVRARP